GGLYVTGGCVDGGMALCASISSAIQRLDIDSSGSLGPWVDAGALPQPLADEAVVGVHGMLHLIGGATSSSGDTASVQGSRIDSTGALGPWAAEPPLPQPRDGMRALTAAGFAFATGGCAAGGCAAPFSDALSAPVAGDGSLGAWQPAGALPGPRAMHGLVVAQNGLYLLGGTNGAGLEATVWYAPFAAAGTVGTWTALPSLPSARGGLAAVAYAGIVYAIGGTSSAGLLDEVWYAQLRAGGTL